MSLTEKQAANLFARLSQATVKIDELAEEIIREQAWKTAGHETLCAAWEARFSELEFQGTVNVKIVFAMLDEGSTPLEIANAVKGISPQTVNLWVEERAQGASDADEIARKRKLPSRPAPSTMFLHFGADRLRNFETYAAECRGRTATELAFDAALELFAVLADEYAASHEESATA